MVPRVERGTLRFENVDSLSIERPLNIGVYIILIFRQ